MAAEAKGGGHGGGGGGHGHSSHSSSSSARRLHSYSQAPSARTTARRSSRRSSRGSSRQSSSWRGSSSATTYAPPPPPKLYLYPDEQAAREGSGFYCPALPKSGERVEVIGESGSARRAKVASSQRPSLPGFESECLVQVDYDDGSKGTMSAAERPRPLVQAVFDDVAPPLAFAGYAALRLWGDGTPWEEAEEEHEALLAELRLASRGDELAPPSGEWWGCSEESDEGDQAVRATIAFGSSGQVSGRGHDGVDGSYRIAAGRWGVLNGAATPTVAWRERYDEGFEVVVRGRYDASAGKIKARFTSSRGVSGTFELAPKPSVF